MLYRAANNMPVWQIELKSANGHHFRGSVAVVWYQCYYLRGFDLWKSENSEPLGAISYPAEYLMIAVGFEPDLTKVWARSENL